MLLSEILFSPKEIKKEKIYGPYGMHRIIYKIFGGGKRPLYADKGMSRGMRKAIVLCDEEPAADGYNISFKTVPEAFLRLGNYKFQIDINPVKRDAKTGKLIPITDYEEIAEWFASKSEKWGFRTSAGNILVNGVSALEFSKHNKDMVTINSANISGLLQTIDSARFEESFRSGLGRAKAYGHGLLQLTPIKIF